MTYPPALIDEASCGQDLSEVTTEMSNLAQLLVATNGWQKRSH